MSKIFPKAQSRISKLTKMNTDRLQNRSGRRHARRSRFRAGHPPRSIGRQKHPHLEPAGRVVQRRRIQGRRLLWRRHLDAPAHAGSQERPRCGLTPDQHWRALSAGWRSVPSLLPAANRSRWSAEAATWVLQLAGHQWRLPHQSRESEASLRYVRAAALANFAPHGAVSIARAEEMDKDPRVVVWLAHDDTWDGIIPEGAFVKVPERDAAFYKKRPGVPRPH
jgi:hypothetical protein